jgi:cytidylate kinase
LLIAIDGPAGAGKSTVARAVAARLGGFTYLDTGAMYRCVALVSLERGLDAPAVAGSVTIAFDGDRVLVDGHDVSAPIRTARVSEAASRVAADPEVRRALVAAQRRLLSAGDWVAEGRDIGTVVAPWAELKVFLTADPVERARRRASELGEDLEAVLASQRERDERDSTRADSPLQPAHDAVLLDTTGLSVAEVVERIADLAAPLTARLDRLR